MLAEQDDVRLKKAPCTLTSGRKDAIIKIRQRAFASVSPAYPDDHDAGHGRLFSFAGHKAFPAAHRPRCKRLKSTREDSAWLSPPSGRIPG